MSAITVPRRRVRSRATRRFLANRPALVGLGFLLFIVLISVFGQLVQRYQPDLQNYNSLVKGPSWHHWLGTDRFGRDLYSRLISGTRVTLLAALEALLTAVVLGIPLGLLAGYIGGMFDAIVSRLPDALLSIPGLLLSIGIVGVIGPGLTHAMLAVGVILAPSFYRIARATAADLRSETFITASRSLGNSNARLLIRHILPNTAGPLLVQVSFATSVAIVAEASLSFLGLGVLAPQSSIGSLIQDSYQTIQQTLWPLIPPSVMIMLLVLSLFFVGDALEAATARHSAGRGE